MSIHTKLLLRLFINTSAGSRTRYEVRVRKKRLTRVMVLEVGLEPTKPEGERFTVSCHCH